MSENLVPQGLPYGERQKQVAARRQAGIPIESPTAPPGRAVAPQPPTAGGAGGLPAAGPIRRVRPTLDLLAETTPDSFPGAITPPAPALARHPSPQQYFVEVASNSQSAFVRAVAARYAARG